MTDLCRERGIGRVGATSALREFGGLRTRSEAIRMIADRYRKHGVCADYFKKIDGERKAYWLGFLLADGSITAAGEIKLRLSYRDREHIRAFANDIGYKGRPTVRVEKSFGKNIKTICIRFAHWEFVQHAERSGLKRGKRNRGFGVPALPRGMYRHLVRGLVDGDGSIIESGYVKRIALCGYPHMLETVRSIIQDSIGIEGCRLVRVGKTKCWVLAYNGRYAVALGRWLYAGASRYLSRKRATFDRWTKRGTSIR